MLRNARSQRKAAKVASETNATILAPARSSRKRQATKDLADSASSQTAKKARSDAHVTEDKTTTWTASAISNDKQTPKKEAVVVSEPPRSPTLDDLFSDDMTNGVGVTVVEYPPLAYPTLDEPLPPGLYELINL